MFAVRFFGLTALINYFLGDAAVLILKLTVSRLKLKQLGLVVESNTYHPKRKDRRVFQCGHIYTHHNF